MRPREVIRKQAPQPPQAPQAPQPRADGPWSSLRTQLTGLLETARRMPLSVWVLLPLRLFLGVTFVYAGLQKLTDPQYFRPSARGYIGKQIAGFATGSPLHNFLLSSVVPHAQFFGALIAYGELAIGLGVLVGLLLRPAAFFGALLSLIFFLTASWRVYPYFYGADIVFLFGWITILLAGPTAGGWPALDTLLVEWALARVAPFRREAVAGTLAFTLGVDTRSREPAAHHADTHALPAHAPRGRSGHAQPVRGGRAAAYARTQSRRDFVRGALAGAAGMLGIVFVVSLFRHGDASAASGDSSLGGSSATTTPAASGTGTPASSTTGTSGGNVIAQVSQLPANSAGSFTIPSNGDPGVVVHLSNGKFVAFDATCTHAGCPVQYNPGDQLLECPCHGAAFDPANSAAPVQGPTDTALTPVSINVNNATGAIMLTG